MNVKTFINEGVSNGISCYILKCQNKEYPTSHIFELRIIEFLATLYGENNILEPYNNADENAFKSNLAIYGASLYDINRLLELLGYYALWLISDSRDSNNIEEIFKILAKLVLYKDESVGIELNEMNKYRLFLSLKDEKIDQIASMSANKEEIFKSFEKAAAEIEQRKKVTLSKDEYERFGVSLNDIQELSIIDLKKLTDQIRNLDRDEASGGSKKDKPLQYVLTSGNGFVDILVLLSIICTEIMVGIVVTVMIARL